VIDQLLPAAVVVALGMVAVVSVIALVAVGHPDRHRRRDAARLLRFLVRSALVALGRGDGGRRNKPPRSGVGGGNCTRN
jgi:hypothetical protein